MVPGRNSTGLSSPATAESRARALYLKAVRTAGRVARVDAVAAAVASCGEPEFQLALCQCGAVSLFRESLEAFRGDDDYADARIRVLAALRALLVPLATAWVAEDAEGERLVCELLAVAGGPGLEPESALRALAQLLHAAGLYEAVGAQGVAVLLGVAIQGVRGYGPNASRASRAAVEALSLVVLNPNCVRLASVQADCFCLEEHPGPLVGCKVCMKPMHQACLEEWRRSRGPYACCPFCRSPLTPWHLDSAMQDLAALASSRRTLAWEATDRVCLGSLYLHACATCGAGTLEEDVLAVLTALDWARACLEALGSLAAAAPRVVLALAQLAQAAPPLAQQACWQELVEPLAHCLVVECAALDDPEPLIARCGAQLRCFLRAAGDGAATARKCWTDADRWTYAELVVADGLLDQIR